MDKRLTLSPQTSKPSLHKVMSADKGDLLSALVHFTHSLYSFTLITVLSDSHGVVAMTPNASLAPVIRYGSAAALPANSEGRKFFRGSPVSASGVKHGNGASPGCFEAPRSAKVLVVARSNV